MRLVRCHVAPLLASELPRQVLFQRTLRNALGLNGPVPKRVSVGCVAPGLAAEARDNTKYSVPSKRCVVLREVASASSPIDPRSMLRDRFRDLRRAAAASKVQRVAERLAAPGVSRQSGALRQLRAGASSSVTSSAAGPSVSRH